MSFTTRSIILVFILTTILVVTLLLETNDSTKIEGFKDPFKELKKVTSFFTFLGKWFKWLGDIMKCSIESIIGLPNCIMFYLLDLFIGTVKLILIFLCSFSPHLEKARLTTWKIITKIDSMIYKVSRFRIIQYPKSILKKCYKCKNKKMPTK